MRLWQVLGDVGLCPVQGALDLQARARECVLREISQIEKGKHPMISSDAEFKSDQHRRWGKKRKRGRQTVRDS